MWLSFQGKNMKINTCMLISKKKFTRLKGMDSSHCNVQLKTCLIQERKEFKRYPLMET